MPLALFTSPGPLLFQLGPFSLRWYGLLIAVAVLLGLMLATRLGKQRGIDPALIADLLPILVLAAVLGARIYYVLFEWRQYQFNWLDALAIWRGGIAIHGALIGGTLAVIVYSRWRKIPFWNLLDVLLPAVALGQAIGRWATSSTQKRLAYPPTCHGNSAFPMATDLWNFSTKPHFTPRSFTNPSGTWA
jgi:phosphatidylglycerol:prolipoprotein diacylglycerol transferase